jgi:hypothetical protein
MLLIDDVELNKWPPVFITEALLSSIARVQSGVAEDAMRDGFATEDADVEEFQGSIPTYCICNHRCQQYFTIKSFIDIARTAVFDKAV